MNSATGEVSVRRDLRTDPAYLQFYRLLVQATGAGQVSTQVAQAFVNITVIRNANPPIFTENEYQRVIADTTPIGTSLVNVEAIDGDGVRKYFDKIMQK